MKLLRRKHSKSGSIVSVWQNEEGLYGFSVKSDTSFGEIIEIDWFKTIDEAEKKYNEYE